MNYSNIISDMVWSYSRITTFEACPYRFLLSYIFKVPKENLFFSDYGLFVHRIIELYLKEILEKDEAPSFYLSNFHKEVLGKAPSAKVFRSYFQQGLEYCNHMNFPYPNPLAVETKLDFQVGGRRFTGVIDCVAEKDDGTGLVILDNKSRSLKPRSAKRNPTKSDNELDDYLRQLYLYSIPIMQEYGTPPDTLEFNCFRSGIIISEPFCKERFYLAKKWAVETVDRIVANDEWSPNMEFWKCRYLCDVHRSCEYYQMNKGW